MHLNFVLVLYGNHQRMQTRDAGIVVVKAGADEVIVDEFDFEPILF